MDNCYVWNYSHPTIPGVEVVERNCPICEEWHSISCDASKLEKYLENKKSTGFDSNAFRKDIYYTQ